MKLTIDEINTLILAIDILRSDYPDDEYYDLDKSKDEIKYKLLKYKDKLEFKQKKKDFE